MEEKMMVMMIGDTSESTITIDYSTWKLYENPSYYHSHKKPYHHHHHHQHHHHISPPSARKLAACLWDLTFIRSIMDSELDMARAKIRELKAEVENERKARKKVEALNKKIGKQILEERKKREAVEDVCQKLAKEITIEKLEMDRMKKDIVEERKMLRVSEVLREERVHMKLSEAKMLFEEKLSELECSKVTPASKLEHSKARILSSTNECRISSYSENPTTAVAAATSTTSNNNIAFVSSILMNKRGASPEAENPHIKRGIRGFVEFPRVVRAISSRGRQLGSKVECQKAQLRLLLRQKSPFRADNRLMG